MCCIGGWGKGDGWEQSLVMRGLTEKASCDTSQCVEIESIRHKALRRLFEEGHTKGIVEPGRLIDMLAFVIAAADFAKLAEPPNFGFHPLTGNRRGSYAMTVTRNWRLTFIRTGDHSIAELDLEDYH